MIRFSGLEAYFSEQTDILLSTEQTHPVEIDDQNVSTVLKKNTKMSSI